jgi:hypothetical protein
VLAVFVALYGPWAWKLHELTGNPFFPFFNGVFRSEWMASINIRDARFLPRSWLQWLFYPFYWIPLQSNLVAEMPFRDLRLALAYVFLAGYGVAALTRKDLRTRLLLGKYRSMHVLVLFLTLSYIVWMHQFSILRYLVAAECLAGIFVIAGTMAVVQRLGRRATWLPALCVISVAGIITGYTVHPKWGRAPVGTDIFAVHAPVFENGALIIFCDQNMSFLAPSLAAAGQDLHFMTIPRTFYIGGRQGDYGLRYELGRRMQAKVAENARSFYVLFRRASDPPLSSWASFGIEADMTTCQPGGSSLGPEFLACRGIHRGTPPL